MEEILNKDDVVGWLRLDDDDDPTIDNLIQIAIDVAEGAIDGFVEKTKSSKFRRKLKLFLLNYIADAHDDRGFAGENNDKMKYVNATLLMQLQYGTYSESDI